MLYKGYALFTGKDRSRGFRTGQTYKVTVKETQGYLWVQTTSFFKPLSCPYTNEETLLKNWDIPSIKYKGGPDSDT